MFSFAWWSMSATSVKHRKDSPELVVKRRRFSDLEEDLYCKFGKRQEESKLQACYLLICFYLGLKMPISVLLSR